MLRSNEQNIKQKMQSVSRKISENKDIVSSAQKCTNEPLPGVIFDKQDKTTETCLKDISDSQSVKTDVQNTGILKSKTTSCGPRYTLSTDIPEKYDDTYICVLPRDPQWLYVYWELPEGSRSATERFYKNESQTEQWVLRLRGQSGNSVATEKSTFDVPIKPADQNAYIHVPDTSAQFSIECGQLSSGGTFQPAVQSTHFETPVQPMIKQNSPCENHDVQSGELIEYLRDSASVQYIIQRNTSENAPQSEKKTGDTASTHAFSSDRQSYFGSASPA